MAVKKAGTVPPPSTRCHCAGTTPTQDTALGATAACSAASPCASPIRAKPDTASIAATRSLAVPRAAMPTSAHAPHCTLVEAALCARRHTASASRHAFAAA